MLIYKAELVFTSHFMRYTGQWIQLYTDLSVDECLTAIRDDPYFTL